MKIISIDILRISCHSFWYFSHFNKGGCCCSAHFGYLNCKCNLFNCNCDTKDIIGRDEGYCQYHRLFALRYKCHPHWNELACGSGSRVIDWKLSNKKSVFFSYSNDKFKHITNISSRMEMILPRRLNQWIFTTYSIKIEMDTYQKKNYGTLFIMHSVSK